MASSQLKAIEYVRTRDGIALKEAFSYVRSVMADPQVDLDVYEIQQTCFAQNLKDATEIVFQVSALKWDACEAIVRALHENGKLIL